ncbi:hypothetical protein N0V82_007182 [Gnomoniopsis sp. IMI 355080]|nr:hypothetical protein N0V82_007182 [Gnomoniopsis sp. IMI 355080]
MVPGLATYPKVVQVTMTESESVSGVLSTSTATIQTIVTTVKTISSLSAFAPMVQINWQSTDLATGTAATSASSRSNNTNNTTTTAPVESINSSAPAPTSSTESVTAIAVGCTVAIVAIAASILFAIFWRRRVRKTLAVRLAAHDNGADGAPKHWEVQDPQQNQLSWDSAPIELNSRTKPVEMVGTQCFPEMPPAAASTFHTPAWTMPQSIPDAIYQSPTFNNLCDQQLEPTAIADFPHDPETRQSLVQEVFAAMIYLGEDCEDAESKESIN